MMGIGGREEGGGVGWGVGGAGGVDEQGSCASRSFNQCVSKVSVEGRVRSNEASGTRPVAVKKVTCDPQSCCFYVLNAGIFWQSRDAPHRLMCDPQSCCFYVLNAGGFWQSRHAPHRLMCDPQSCCFYVLNAGGFWQSRDARHRLICDKPS